MQKNKTKFTLFFIIVCYWSIPNYVSGENITKSHWLGSNSQCDDNIRIRRDWDLIGSSEKELFLQAVEDSIDRGIYQKFIDYHADLNSSIQSHETCAFILWHRRYLLAFENMLRSLNSKYACLTIPYWNILEHFRDQERGLCESFGTCARVVSELGGVPMDFNEDRVFSGIEANGQVFSGRPIRNLKDDFGNQGIVRGSLLDIEIPSSCAYEQVLDIFKTSTSYMDFARKVQTTIHDDVHDFIGGMMPTFSSPSDPLFLVWHSFIDLLLYIWEVCNLDKSLIVSPSAIPFDPFHQTEASCSYTERAANTFPNTLLTTEMHMKSAEQDVREDPLIGKYFRDVGLAFLEVSSIWKLNENEFGYDHLTPPLWEFLKDPVVCPANDWLSKSPTTSPTSMGPTAVPDLPMFEEWLQNLKNDLENIHQDNPKMVDAKISFLLCTLDGKRDIPSNSFRQDLLDGTVNNPSCNFFLNVKGNDAPTTVQTTDSIPSSESFFTPKTLVVEWFIPNEEDLDEFVSRNARVGDTIIFEWSGTHNVFIHPSGDCLEDGSIFIGSKSGETMYTFNAEDVSKVVFTCDIGSHCEAGQFIEFTVSNPDTDMISSGPTIYDTSDPTSSSIEKNGPQSCLLLFVILFAFIFL